MTQSHPLGGPALRRLAATSAPSTFLPSDLAEPVEKARDRIWELANTLHCSIVGTCLTTADGRALLAKLGIPNARTMSEHHLHGQVVHLAGRREGGGKLLQKMLDRRHEAEIRRFDKARTVAEVRSLWKDFLGRGEIPGAYWAAMTHPATDWTLVQELFGEVHMLSHLVGQSNRADIRRLCQLEADLAATAEAAAAQDLRIRDLMEQRDGLKARNRSFEAARALTQAAGHTSEPEPDREHRKGLEARVAREQAHAEALEEKLTVLMQASSRMSVALESEIARRRTAESELAAIEATLVEERDAPGASSPAVAESLYGRTLLYVGGRPRQVANLRRFTLDRGGRLLNHDGGIEDSLSLLPGLVGQSDLVLFPVECVSHEAVNMVKRCCEATGTAYRPVRSASLASFVHTVLPAKPVHAVRCDD